MLEKKEFPELTGIRFIAATLVFLSHYADELTQSQDSFGYILLRQLNIGVNLFFVLSGFLITYRYYDVLFSPKTFRLYLAKRVARIFPLYILIFAIHFFLLWHHQNKMPYSLWLIFLNITLLKGFSANYYLSGVIQSWSLTVEEMFYLFAPFSFYLIKAKNFFIEQIFVLTAIGFLAVWIFIQYPFEGFFESVRFMFSATFFGRCFEFFAGMYVALRIMESKRHGSTKFFTITGGLLFIVLLAILAFYAYQRNEIHANDTFLGILLFNFLIPVAISIFYYGLLIEKTVFKKMLGHPLIVLLGKSSYAFYLIHIGMIAEVIYFHFTTNILLLYVCLQIVSVLVYKTIEKPVYFFILRKFASQKQNLLPE